MTEEKQIDPRYETMFPEYDDILYVSDVCRMLKIDKKKAYKLIRSGELRSLKLDRAIRVAKLWVIEYVIARGEWTAVNIHVQRQLDIMDYCKKPRSRREMQQHLGLCDMNHFKDKVLKPLLAEGKLRMTMPDKPHHVGQRYVVVSKI